MDLVYFFRRKIQGRYSIEFIFEPFIQKIPGARAIYVPFLASGLISIIRNIYFARRNQRGINHVTGDIHYVILGLSRKNRNVLTIHDCGILFDPDKPKWKLLILKYLWFVWPVRLAEIITTVSEKSKSEIIQLTNCLPSKIVVIPNYVNPDFVFQPKEFNVKRPRILHIGSTRNKNLSRVIMALKGLQCELRIIGLISDEDAELLQTNDIFYTQLLGVSTERIIQEYCDTDIVLFASTYEGFGLPILEAQATGRVLITSDISPCREIAGNGALCVDPHNVQEIREAVESVVANHELRSGIIQSGLENVKRYSMEVVLGEYMQVYSKPGLNQDVLTERL